MSVAARGDRACFLFTIRGRVQGVCFRDATRTEALRLGLCGHARNLADGSVQVLACGTGSAIDTLAGWLASGPPLARVDSVERTAEQISPPAGFTIG